MLEDIKNSVNPNAITLKFNQEINLIVNKELFYIALKNIIENGLKYSTDNEVTIEINNKQISIITKGDKLKKELEYYTQPFTQEYKNSKGFGLGLYIVYEIVKLHKFVFEYKHSDGYNIFQIII